MLGMVENRDEHREPIIRFARRVMRGNSHVSRKALSGGGLFVSMNKERIEKHIEQSNYFGTLAAVLSLARQTLERGGMGRKNSHIKLLQSLEEDLMYLQDNYKIEKK